MSTTNILYITYDGLTDPLGRSQILPYLMELSKKDNRIYILSCDKTERYVSGKDKIIELIKDHNIEWHPVFYHKNPPILSTIIDIRNLRRKAKEIVKTNNIKIVHCRSYVASIVGLKLKREYGIRFIFDMRGFFADERVDGNVWNQKNPIYKWTYNYFKKKEKAFFSESDKIVSLTENGKSEILKMNLFNVEGSKIEVIPCCADFSHFNIQDDKIRSEARAELNFRSEQLVFGYLGSLGTWYLISDTLKLFKEIKTHISEAKLLIISNDTFEPYKSELDNYQIDENDIVIINSSREKLPYYLSAVDIGISFIKTCFSKRASSPTKIAEMLAMRIPIIINKGVGDLDKNFSENNFGIDIELDKERYFENVEDNIVQLKEISKERIRSDAKKLFDLLNVGVENYNKIYNELKA